MPPRSLPRRELLPTDRRIPQAGLILLALLACACHKGRATAGPSFVVSASMEGASPAEAEGMATVLERECAQLPKVARLQGTAREGAATVRVEMERGTDADATMQSLLDALKTAGPMLPRDASAPVVSRGTGAVVVRHLFRSEVLPLSAVTQAEEASWGMKASQVAGVGVVEVCGERAPRVLVEVDAARLAAMGMTLADVAAALRKGSASVAAGMAPLVIRYANGAPVRLSDVATVTDDATPPRCLAFDEKGPVIETTVRAQTGGDRAKVREALASTEQAARVAIPSGVAMTAMGPGRTVDVDLDPAETGLRAPEALREAVAKVPGVGPFLLEVGPGSDAELPSGARVRLGSPDEAVAARVAATLRMLPFVRGAGEPNAMVELVGADRAAIEAQAEAMRTAVGAHARIVQRLGGDREVVTRVLVDEATARKLGVASADVALVVQAREGVTVSTFFDGQSLAIPVVLRAKGTLDQLYVKGASGPVPLSALASMKSEPVESVLLHEGLFPMIGVSVQTDDVKALEKAFQAPEGMQYRVMPTG